MTDDKTKEKIIKPLEYKISKDRDSSMAESTETLDNAETVRLRTAVLKEINESSPLTAKEKEREKQQKNVTLDKKREIQAQLPFRLNIKRLVFLWLKALIGLLLFSFIVTTVGIYLAGWQSQSVRVVAGYIPYPAALVNKSFISLNDYLNDLSALENYLERNNLKFTATEIRSRVMKNLIEKEVIKQLAKKSKITVTKDEVAQELANSSLEKTSQEQLDKLVADLYGWNFVTYLEKVVRPLILIKKIEADFNQQSGNAPIREKMDDYSRALSANPEEFEKIAAAVNEDKTKVVAGDLGWFKLNDVGLEMQSILLNLKNNELSRVIETDAGYQIIKLNERVIDEKDGQPYFRVSQIFLKKSSFKKYLDDEVKKAKVITLIKI